MRTFWNEVSSRCQSWQSYLELAAGLSTGRSVLDNARHISPQPLRAAHFQFALCNFASVPRLVMVMWCDVIYRPKLRLLSPKLCLMFARILIQVRERVLLGLSLRVRFGDTENTSITGSMSVAITKWPADTLSCKWHLLVFSFDIDVI